MTGKRIDIGGVLKKSIIALLNGEFLMRLRVDKYFFRILWIALLCLTATLFHLGVDMTLLKVEQNKSTIKELEIEYSQKTYDLSSLGRRSTVIEKLRENGSSVTEPDVPATRLKEED